MKKKKKKNSQPQTKFTGSYIKKSVYRKNSDMKWVKERKINEKGLLKVIRKSCLERTTDDFTFRVSARALF